ncbi:MAG: protein-L-isoaspartate O-methyltransferase family protein [Sphingopyxis sp.]
MPTATTAVDQLTLRRAMVDCQLRPNDVTQPALVAAALHVPREAFVPAAHAAMAYGDRAVPLGDSRALNPTLTTARLIADADVQAGHHVLVIGGATGYAAALLAQLGAVVVMVESAPALVAAARAALAGNAAITILDGPLADGAPGQRVFDRLIIDGAVEAVPAALYAQLADGARVATGLMDRGVTRLARAVHIAGQAAVQPLPFHDLECVHLPGFAPNPSFTF